MALTPAISLCAEASSRWRFAKTEASFLRNMPAARPDNISTNQIATGNGPTALRFLRMDGAMGKATKSAGIANWSAVYVSIRSYKLYVQIYRDCMFAVAVWIILMQQLAPSLPVRKNLYKRIDWLLCVCAIHFHVYVYIWNVLVM